MKSAVTTHIGSRLILTLAMVALIGACYWAMRQGWKRQGRSQSDLASPREVGVSSPRFFGIYASTTFHNQPLKRVVAHGLGARTSVEVGVSDSAIDIYRPGSRSFSIAKSDVVGVSRASGIAGKFMGKDFLTLITWKLGNQIVDTGLLISDPEFAKEVGA